MYLLLWGLPKRQFLATGAAFFFVINASKIPIHIWLWRTMEPEVIATAAVLLVPMIVGAGVGMVIARHLPERYFRLTVVALAALASLRLVV